MLLLTVVEDRVSFANESLKIPPPIPKYGSPDGSSVVEAAFDLDFDGGADLRLVYENGRLARTELARRPDGVPRTWSHFEGGKLVRKERDADGDGKADGWILWHGGELDRIGVDLDGYGRADRWEARPQVPPEAIRSRPPP